MSRERTSITTDDGWRIAYRFDGPSDAPVLMLSNSLGTDREMWNPQIRAFSAHFRVLRYDSRGHGGSDAPPGAYSIDRLGRDAVELLDCLAIDKAHFCGLSLGGMVGQWLAVRAPERIDRLILANTSACMGPSARWQTRIEAVLKDGMQWLTDASIGRWFTPDFVQSHSDLIEPIRRMLSETNPVGYAGCCAAIRDMDMRALAPLNRLPTLVIAGDQDPATSVTDGKWLAESAADGRLAILLAAHLSNVQCPDKFAALVLDFLRAD
jgi:3-oxoadipate enol-lactonase